MQKVLPWNTLIEVPTIRRFAGIDMIRDRIPAETSILAFRHLLEKHDPGKRIFEVVKRTSRPTAGHETGHDH